MSATPVINDTDKGAKVTREQCGQSLSTMVMCRPLRLNLEFSPFSHGMTVKGF